MHRDTRLGVLCWILGVVALLDACAPAGRGTTAALLDDARECEVASNEQLRGSGHANDTTIRMLFFRSCMALRGWTADR